MAQSRGRPTREEIIAKKRKSRISLGGMRQKLSAKVRRGYKRYWFNDTPGRLQEATDAGYEYVIDPKLKVGDPDLEVADSVDSRISKVVDRETGMKAYLMEIEEELWQEDRDKAARQITESEKSLQSGVDDYGQPGRDGRYTPGSGTQISQETR